MLESRSLASSYSQTVSASLALHGKLSDNKPTETSLQPIVNASCLTTTQTYLIMMLDPEAELTKPLSNQTVPGSNLLHWIFGNLTYDPSLELLATVDPDNVYNDPISALAGCIGPGPAPGITKPVHDYTMLLFDQPDNFTYPANYTEFWNTTGSTARSGFPYEEFIEQSGLGQPIASNWWTELTPPCNGTRETYFGYCPGK